MAMDGGWQPAVATSTRPTSLPPLPRPKLDRATVDLARGLEAELRNRPPGVPRRLKAYGQQQWTQRGDREAGLFRRPAEPPMEFQRVQSVGAISRTSSRRTARESNVEAAPSERSSAKRTASSNTLRAVKAAYKVPSRPGSPDSHDEALEIGGQEAQERREALLRKQLREMRTGDDAVSYFTRYGGNTQAKIIYCLPASSLTQENEAPGPYDLVVVQEDRIRRETGEYFTITPSGVVHVVPGQLSDCVSLSEWVHQSMVYRLLTRMSFFRLYMHRKMVAQWRRHAKDASFCRKRARLARTCFFSRPTLLQPMLQVKEMVFEVGATPLISFPNRCARLEDFTSEVESQLVREGPEAGVFHDLERRREAIVAALEGLIGTVRHSSDLFCKRRTSQIKSFASSRVRSIAQDKHEAKERFRREQIVHEDEAAIRGCIRLADCMLQANLAASVASAAEELRHRVEGGSTDNKRKMFAIAARLGAKAGEVVLEPSGETFLKVFNMLYEELMGVADAVPAISTASSLLSHAPCAAACAVSEVLQNSRSWSEHLRSTKGKLLLQVQEAQHLAVETYEPYRRIYDYQRDWDKASFSKQPHTFESLSEQVELMGRFQEELNKFRVQRHLGVLVLEARELRDQLLPVPASVLAAVWPVMRSTAQHEGHILAERLERLTEELDQRPTEMLSLQAYAHAVEIADREEVDLQVRIGEVQGVFATFRKHGVRVLPEDAELVEKLAEQMEEFWSTLPAAKGYLTQKRRDRKSVV